MEDAFNNSGDGDQGWEYHSDDETDQKQYWNTGRQALLVLVSAQPDMFRPWHGSDITPMLAALKCCESLWRTKVISSPKDKAGIVFLGTEHTKKAAEFQHMFTYQELSIVTAGMIKELRKMIASPDLGGFQESIGTHNSLDLKQAFWLSKIFFEEANVKSYDKKIMLFTCDDNPHNGDPDIEQEILQKVGDLGNVEISVVSFNPTFDDKKIYSKIVQDQSNIMRTDDLEKLLKIVRIKQRVKRPLVRSTLEIAPKMKLGVGIYTCIRKATKPKKERIVVEEDEKVPGQTVTEVAHRIVNVFNANTGMPILKTDVVKSVTVGEKKVDLKFEDLQTLKYEFETGVRVIGFLDSDTFDHQVWHRTNPYFVYPDETTITGSTPIFSALLRRCHALNKIALVRFVLTRGRNPQIGCLVPSLGTKAITAGLSFPQGFHLTVLPFADEIRHHDYEGMSPPKLLQDVMKQVVMRLTQRNFTPVDVKNPNLYNLWRHIESYALEIPVDEQEEFIDFMKPSVSHMDQRLENLPLQLQDILTVEGISSSKSKGKSRSASATPAKKVKIDFDIENEWKHERLEKLTVAVLRAFCDERHIPYPQERPKQAKAIFVRNIGAYFSKNASKRA